MLAHPGDLRLDRWGRRKQGCGPNGPGEVETSDEVTSMHDSRGDLVLGERVNEKNGSERKQDYDKSWVVPKGESVGSVGTKSGKQNDEVIERGERSGFIRDIVDWNEDTEEVANEKEKEAIYHSVYALEDLPLMQKQDPELAELITYLSTGDLSKSDRAARKILLIQDQFTIDDGVLWIFFCS